MRRIALAPLLVAALALAALTAVDRRAAAEESGVRLDRREVLRAQPRPSARSAGKAPAGAEVVVVERKGAWVRVRFRGRSGWIPKTALVDAPPADEGGEEGPSSEDDPTGSEEGAGGRGEGHARFVKKGARFVEGGDRAPDASRVVVVAARADLLSRPVEGSAVVGTAKTFEELGVVRQSRDGHWYQVDMGGGEVGWVSAASVRVGDKRKGTGGQLGEPALPRRTIAAAERRTVAESRAARGAADDEPARPAPRAEPPPARARAETPAPAVAEERRRPPREEPAPPRREEAQTPPAAPAAPAAQEEEAATTERGAELDDGFEPSRARGKRRRPKLARRDEERGPRDDDGPRRERAADEAEAVVDQETTTKPRRPLRIEAQTGFAAVSQRFESDSDELLANYLIKTNAATIGLGGVYTMALGSKLQLRAVGNYRLAFASPGVKVVAEDGSEVQLAYVSHGLEVAAELGVPIGWRGLLAYGRVGGILVTHQLTANAAAALPSDRVLGGLFGAGADAPLWHRRIWLRGGLDVLAPAARAQTGGLREGTKSTTLGVAVALEGSMRLFSRFTLDGGYRLEHLRTKFSGAHDVNRDAGDGGNRTNTDHVLMLGVGYKL